MGANEKMGLPFGKMRKIAICFDVDGTLINSHGGTIQDTNRLLRSVLLQKWKNVDIIVWSGGGKTYAEKVVSRIWPDLSGAGTHKIKFFSKEDHLKVREKYHLILAIDDIQDTAIGDVNLIVRNR